MKKHAIIPIFIPHRGCPNDCVFCNQKAITARSIPPSLEEVATTIETHLTTLTNRGIKTIEVAFFGGSFTGIPLDQQTSFLKVANGYKEQGKIQKIHLSTRPDYIDNRILDNLKQYGVDIIELGVQSFDDEVLRLSGRGHSSGVVHQSAALIKSYGFELGIQLMIGLPGDTYAKDIFSAKETIKIAPSIARLYPTIIINDTELSRMYQRGDYRPLTQEEAVNHTKDMYILLKNADIHVIRIGLKSTDYIDENGEVEVGTFHPAFRQLVESEIAKEILEKQLEQQKPHKKTTITFLSNGRSFSNMVGNRKSNRIYFEEKYLDYKFLFQVDPKLEDDMYQLSLR